MVMHEHVVPKRRENAPPAPKRRKVIALLDDGTA
jgi:hypothetical protein